MLNALLMVLLLVLLLLVRVFKFVVKTRIVLTRRVEKK